MTGPLGIVDSATLLAAFENYVDMVMETDFKWFKNLHNLFFVNTVFLLNSKLLEKRKKGEKKGVKLGKDSMRAANQD